MKRSSTIACLFLSGLIVAHGAHAASQTEVTNSAGGISRILFVERAGVQVPAGGLLVLLDAQAQSDLLAQARSDCEAARIASTAATSALSTLDRDQAQKRQDLERDLSAAEAALARYRDGDMLVERRSADQGLSDAAYALEVQKERFEQRDKLLADGIIRKTEWDGEEVALKRVQSAYENAQVRSRNVTADTTTQLQKLEQEAAKKKEALDLFNASGASESAARKSKAARENGRLESLELRVTLLEKALKSAAVTAPSAGVFQPAEQVRVSGTVIGGERLGWIVTGT